ncbi:MAG: hypothetical protein M5U28_17725 [Sandaracinaceae bacterium]|nr:hypothetical protein [Sandaracinaceae bacterium]
MKVRTIERHEKATEVSDAVTIIATPGHSSHFIRCTNHGASAAALSGMVAHPFSMAIGPRTSQAKSAPASMLIPVRSEPRAPTAIISGDGSSATVAFIRVTCRPPAAIVPGSTACGIFA